jgi:hypothetical protein
MNQSLIRKDWALYDFSSIWYLSKIRCLKNFSFIKRTEYNFGRLCSVKCNQIAAHSLKREEFPLKDL